MVPYYWIGGILDYSLLKKFINFLAYSSLKRDFTFQRGLWGGIILGPLAGLIRKRIGYSLGPTFKFKGLTFKIIFTRPLFGIGLLIGWRP